MSSAINKEFLGTQDLKVMRVKNCNETLHITGNNISSSYDTTSKDASTKVFEYDPREESYFCKKHRFVCNDYSAPYIDEPYLKPRYTVDDHQPTSRFSMGNGNIISKGSVTLKFDEVDSDDESNQKDSAAKPLLHISNLKDEDNQTPSNSEALNANGRYDLNHYSVTRHILNDDDKLCNSLLKKEAQIGNGSKDPLHVNGLHVQQHTLNADGFAPIEAYFTTPTGSCLKAGSKTSAGGAHVQFETHVNAQDILSCSEVDTEHSDPSEQNKANEPFFRLWARLQTESSDYTPFSSFRKHRKKRHRQPSGSSTVSVGSSSTSTSESRATEFERKAPDGGWGWVVVFASFMVHCIADGVTMSFGVLFVEFLSYFEQSRSLTSWIGSLFMAIPLLAGPVASAVTDRYGCRAVTIWGAIIACLGFFVSAFSNSILILLITLGFITGIGLAVCYVAAIVVVAFYFEKRRSLATGIAVAGSGIGTFIFAPIIQYLLENFGWRGCLILLAGIFLNMAVCGSLMRDLQWTKRRTDKASVPNTTCSSRRGSVTQLSDTLDADVAVSSNIPSIDELKRLVQSGEIASLWSLEDPPHDITRSESLVLLPTFLSQNHALPNDVLPYLTSNANAYEFVSLMYPHLLSYNLSQTELQSKNIFQQKKVKTLRTQRSLQKEEQDEPSCVEDLPNADQEESTKRDESSGLICRILKKEGVVPSSFWTKNDSEEVMRNVFIKKDENTTLRQEVSRRIGTSSPLIPVAPLRDMRITRQSMTFRGAMLNIHRYRLRASSCPDIFRNSIITIAEAENQNVWSYLQDVKDILKSCLDVSYCTDGAFLIFALSNFILYVYYDTVYMYLTDYAQGVGIPPEDGANLISAIGILNCIGMILMGYFGDKPWCSPLLIYNVSMVACGLSVILMPFITNYWMLAAASAVFGLFISANYALTAVILVELISLEAFSKSYGLLLLIQGVANLLGPPLVGFMADWTGDYVIPFVVSGIFIVICGGMLSFIPVIQRLRRQSDRVISSQSSLPSESPVAERPLKHDLGVCV